MNSAGGMLDRLKTMRRLAILLLIIALGYSISADPQSRHCDYLYSKHSRLTTMFDAIHDLESEHEKFIVDTSVRHDQGELSQAEKGELAGRMVLERISSVATVERAFDRNRDIVDQGMSDETDSAIGGLREYASSLDVAEASRE